MSLLEHEDLARTPILVLANKQVMRAKRTEQLPLAC